MTMTHDELRKLAEAATPGPWMWWGGYGGDLSSEAPNLDYGKAEVLGIQQGTVYSEYSADPATLVINEENAAYIAAANPKAVLELLDRIAELEGAEQRGYDAAKEQAANAAENTYDHSWFLGQDPVKSPYRMHIAAAIRAMVRP